MMIVMPSRHIFLLPVGGKKTAGKFKKNVGKAFLICYPLDHRGQKFFFVALCGQMRPFYCSVTNVKNCGCEHMKNSVSNI
jgi:hypothetical protein